MKKTPVAQAATQAVADGKPTEQLIAYPVSFVSALANYLADRPFKEVANLIQGLQQLGTVPKPEPAPADPPAA